MADFNVKITQTYQITARNEEQAQERAERMGSAMNLNFTEPPYNPKWVGDMLESEVEVEKDE